MAIKRIKGYSLATIPESITEMREEAGYSQVDLAKASGISKSAISRYESGTRTMTIDSYLKIVEACGHQLQII